MNTQKPDAVEQYKQAVIGSARKQILGMTARERIAELTAERDALKAEVEAGKVRRGQPYWWCPKCKIEVDGKQVTYWERHEMCGGEVEIKTEPYTEAKGEP